MKSEDLNSATTMDQPLKDGHYFQTNYTNLRRLKKAIYGSVQLCYHHATQQNVAVKVIAPQCVKFVRQMKAQGDQQKEDWIAELDANLRIARAGGHPSVVRLLEYFEENQAVFIVMEWCDGGEMFDMLENNDTASSPSPWDASSCREIFRKYMEGVLFLHSLDLCHRDLSLENTLFHSSYGPKICDFGACCSYDPSGVDASLVVRDRGGRDLCVNRVGKQFYMSPQILNGEKYDAKATDVWSSGAFLFLLVTGHPCWEWAHAEYDQSGSYQRYLEGGPEAFRQTCHAWGFLHRFTDECWDLLIHMLHPDESLRYTAMECLDHPWLKKVTAATNETTTGTAAAVAAAVATTTDEKEVSWNATATWEELNPDQQSRIRTLKNLLTRRGQHHITFQKALRSIIDQSGWTVEQLQSLGVHVKAEQDGSERCIVM